MGAPTMTLITRKGYLQDPFFAVFRYYVGLGSVLESPLRIV